MMLSSRRFSLLNNYRACKLSTPVSTSSSVRLISSTTKDELARRIQTSLSRGFGEEMSTKVGSLLTRGKPEFGDYQCNIAMSIAKLLKSKPRSIAEEIVKNLKVNDMVDDVNISGPGFINLKLSNSYVKSKISGILLDSSGRLGIEKSNNVNHQQVVVDFSSPNIAKEMHVGHLRSTIIGDCISRLLLFKGHRVKKLNHVGDWGTQFGMLIHYMRTEKRLTNTTDLSDLVHLYKLAKMEFDSSAEFQHASRLEVRKLQNGDHENIQIWKEICGASRVEFQKIYDMLGIEDLEERGESYYNSLMPGILQLLEDKNLLVDSDGASCVFLPGYTNRDGTPQPLIMRKSDGGFLYATSDMAALCHRVCDENADRILYVTDSGQAHHFNMVFDTARAANLLNRSPMLCSDADKLKQGRGQDQDQHELGHRSRVELQHVPFGLVLGEDGKKFKTRSGDVVKLKDLLEKAVERAEEGLLLRNDGVKLTVEQTRAAIIIGIGSVKYADLCMNRESNYRFSYDKMLSLNGNTAPFMMYAYVRIRGIQRKALRELVDHGNIPEFSVDHLLLESDMEINLAKHIIRFPEVLADVEKNLFPHVLCDYLFELSQKFNQFYEHCHVINAPSTELRTSRTGICIATADTLEIGMRILGIEMVESL